MGAINVNLLKKRKENGYRHVEPRAFFSSSQLRVFRRFPVLLSRIHKAVSPVLAIAYQFRQLLQQGKLH